MTSSSPQNVARDQITGIVLGGGLSTRLGITQSKLLIHIGGKLVLARVADTLKMVCSELLMADDRSVLIPEGSQNVDLGSKIQLWRKEAAEILNRYKEIVVFS